MIEVNVKADFDAIIRKLRAMPKAVESAQISALNKAADQSRTKMQRAITSTYNLPAAFVRDRLSVTRASRKGQATYTAALVGSDRKQSMNLIHFLGRVSGKEKAAWRKQVSKTGRLYAPQVPFSIKKGKGNVFVKGAFIGNNGRTVFIRDGKTRLPISPVQTINVKGMFRSRKNTGEITDWLRANLPRIFESELKFYMNRFVTKGY